MGIGIASVQNILELNQLGYFKNMKNILEIGSQELHLKFNDLELLLKNAGITDFDKNNFKNIDNWPNPNRCSSKPFYKLLGFTDYYSLDANKELGSIDHDYNKPFNDKNFYNKFDLVTDFGSCEHAFNMGEIYKTIHKICKVNGKIIISQAMWGGNGYYLFDKSFFESLAAFNNYKILYNSYVIVTKDKTINGSDSQYHIPMSKNLLNSINLNNVNVIGVFGVLEKMEDNEFVYPNQYFYSMEKSKSNQLGFNRLFYKDPPSYSYIPIYENSISTKHLLQILKKRIKSKFFK